MSLWHAVWAQAKMGLALYETLASVSRMNKQNYGRKFYYICTFIWLKIRDMMLTSKRIKLVFTI
jgi:hypothetical protein